MATFTFKVEGMQELFQKMKKAEEKSLGIAAQGLYDTTKKTLLSNLAEAAHRARAYCCKSF